MFWVIRTVRIQMQGIRVILTTPVRILRQKPFIRMFLNLWNLAIDINNSFKCSNPYLNGCHDLYDKVFWGNNLDV